MQLNDLAHFAALDNWISYVDKVFVSRLGGGKNGPEQLLLPASTASTVHGDYAHAWVRDNVYTILAPWALSRALRRWQYRPDDAARLEQATRQVMRGLLSAMMAQAGKVEKFKQTQNPRDGLHAKYDAATGHVVVGDDGWGHLQIDATSVFILTLAQMHAAGLKLVENRQEAAFVQNLVHYIGPAYRIADYGIWERGRKMNDGLVEINASSVAMAKAALEAISAMPLLIGPDGPDPLGIIHVVPDDIARARETLLALLPNESASKETDAALLSAIFWPAYALADADILALTRERMLSRLIGHYGLKRFLRDGHQTALEDHGRLHYERGELNQFDKIESEWPLFFTYLLVDARLRGDPVNAAHWRMKLEPLFVQRDAIALLPELYLVPEDRVRAEKAEPGSQPRLPNENVPLFWAQSLWTIGALLGEHLILPEDVDPLGRRTVPGDSMRGLRQPIRVVILAEDKAAQQAFADAGMTVATVSEVEPHVRVRDVGQLRKWFADVGACPELGLSGRPEDRRLGAKTCARLYHDGQGPIAFAATLPEGQDSYLRRDPAFRARMIAGDLRYLAQHARGADPVMFVVTMDESSLKGAGQEQLLALLRAISTGSQLAENGLGAVNLTYMSIADAMVDVPTTYLTITPPATLNALPVPAPEPTLLSEDECIALLEDARNHGDREAMFRAEMLSAESSQWHLAREAAESLGQVGVRLVDGVKDLVVRMRRLDLSALGRNETYVITSPTSEAELLARLTFLIGAGSGALSVVAQEVIVALGLIVKQPSTPLRGIRTIRLAEWLDLLAREMPDGLSGLVRLSPSRLLARIDNMLAQTLNVRGMVQFVGSWQFLPGIDPYQDWSRWRRRLGVMLRVRTDFYARVWRLLCLVDGLHIGHSNDPAGFLDAKVARGDFTSHERDFAHVIDSAITRIVDPRYRAMILECLNVLAEFSVRYVGQTLTINGAQIIELDVLIHAAVMDLAGTDTLTEKAWNLALESRPDRMADSLSQAVEILVKPAPAAQDRDIIDDELDGPIFEQGPIDP